MAPPEIAVIVVVVALVLIVHWKLFKWVRFKVDESAVIEYLKGLDDPVFQSESQISAGAGVSESRVITVCRASECIESCANSSGVWRLI